MVISRSCNFHIFSAILVCVLCFLFFEVLHSVNIPVFDTVTSAVMLISGKYTMHGNIQQKCNSYCLLISYRFSFVLRLDFVCLCFYSIYSIFLVYCINTNFLSFIYSPVLSFTFEFSNSFIRFLGANRILFYSLHNIHRFH